MQTCISKNVVNCNSVTVELPIRDINKTVTDRRDMNETVLNRHT